MSTNEGLYKHIEESNLSESDTKELREVLAPAKKFKQDKKVWRVLPDGDWVRIR